MKLTIDQLNNAAFAMQLRGGSFMQRIGEAWQLADPLQRAKLEGVFGDEFTEYYDVYVKKEVPE